MRLFISINVNSIITNRILSYCYIFGVILLFHKKKAPKEILPRLVSGILLPEYIYDN